MRIPAIARARELDRGPARLRLSPAVRFTENGQRLPVGAGQGETLPYGMGDGRD